MPSSVRAVTSSTSATSAASTEALWPVSTQSGPSGRALVVPSAGSHWSGASPIAQAASSDPSASAGRYWRCWSAEPDRTSASATTETGSSGPGAIWRPISSATMTRSSTGCSVPMPPNSSGTRTAASPSSAACPQ